MRAVALASLAALLGGTSLALAGGGIATEGAADMDAPARALLEGSTWVNGDPAKNCNKAALSSGGGGFELYVSNIGWPFWITIRTGRKQDSALITALKLSGDRLSFVFSDKSRSDWHVDSHDRITRSNAGGQALSRCPGPRLSQGLPMPGE